MHDEGFGWSPHHMYDDAGIRLPGPIHPPKKRELLSGEDLANLGETITYLDEESGIAFTGTIQFKGHSFPVAFDSANGVHLIGI